MLKRCQMELTIREFDRPWVMVRIQGKDKRECFEMLLRMDNNFGRKFANTLTYEQPRQELLNKVTLDNNWIFRWRY